MVVDLLKVSFWWKKLWAVTVLMPRTIPVSAVASQDPVATDRARSRWKARTRPSCPGKPLDGVSQVQYLVQHDGPVFQLGWARTWMCNICG